VSQWHHAMKESRPLVRGSAYSSAGVLGVVIRVT
jgi:hypothetical protein